MFNRFMAEVSKLFELWKDWTSQPKPEEFEKSDLCYSYEADLTHVFDHPAAMQPSGIDNLFHKSAYLDRGPRFQGSWLKFVGLVSQ